ncbi:PxKF domain-containing protein [Shewanella seohaensis]|uniref:PxKF domain-containing protein n=1 Tax=Shewanella seohaensis TaxID=755175 RepID=A0ABV4VUJ0_9GAMM
MLNGSMLKRSSWGVGGVVLLLATSVFAKETAYFSGVTEVKINGATTMAYVVNPNGSPGVDLASALAPNTNVSMKLTWSIIDKNEGQKTEYPQDMSLSAATSDGSIPSNSITISPDKCTFTSITGTCEFVISFTTPNTEGGFHINVDAVTKNSGPNGLLNSDAVISFTVAEPQQAPAKIDTAIAVVNQCYEYQAGDVEFNATLTASPNVPIAGATLNFGINTTNDNATSSLMDAAQTNLDGVANITYNINDLTAGDYFVLVDYEGDNIYDSSASSGTLGIYYSFNGFLPPINDDNTSIFGNGRVIPVKIKLVDANGTPVVDAKPEIQIYKTTDGIWLGEEEMVTSSVSAADSGQTMRYDPVEQQYIYNADLSGLDSGTYAIVVDTGGSSCNGETTHAALITVQKKGNKK